MLTGTIIEYWLYARHHLSTGVNATSSSQNSFEDSCWHIVGAQ